MTKRPSRSKKQQVCRVAMHFNSCQVLPGYLRRKVDHLDVRENVGELVKAWELACILYSKIGFNLQFKSNNCKHYSNFGAMAQVQA